LVDTRSLLLRPVTDGIQLRGEPVLTEGELQWILAKQPVESWKMSVLMHLYPEGVSDTAVALQLASVKDSPLWDNAIKADTLYAYAMDGLVTQLNRADGPLWSMTAQFLESTENDGLEYRDVDGVILQHATLGQKHGRIRIWWGGDEEATWPAPETSAAPVLGNAQVGHGVSPAVIASIAGLNLEERAPEQHPMCRWDTTEWSRRVARWLHATPLTEKERLGLRYESITWHEIVMRHAGPLTAGSCWEELKDGGLSLPSLATNPWLRQSPEAVATWWQAWMNWAGSWTTQMLQDPVEYRKAVWASETLKTHRELSIPRHIVDQLSGCLGIIAPWTQNDRVRHAQIYLAHQPLEQQSHRGRAARAGLFNASTVEDLLVALTVLPQEEQAYRLAEVTDVFPPTWIQFNNFRESKEQKAEQIIKLLATTLPLAQWPPQLASDLLKSEYRGFRELGLRLVRRQQEEGAAVSKMRQAKLVATTPPLRKPRR